MEVVFVPKHIPPESLLHDVSWSFWERQPFATMPEFETAVTAWMALGEEEDPDAANWRPHDIALTSPLVSVHYFGVTSPDDMEYCDMVAELRSDAATGFTRLELLFKLHNAVVTHLSAVDHCHFEGLERSNAVEDGTPVYTMQQGS